MPRTATSFVGEAREARMDLTRSRPGRRFRLRAASESSAMASLAPFDGPSLGTGFASIREAPPVLRAGMSAFRGVFDNGKAHAHRRGASGGDPGRRFERST